MSAGRAMRVIAWAASGVGIFIAFLWPFVVSSDPDSATLRVLARATVVVLLVALAAAAAMRARRRS